MVNIKIRRINKDIDFPKYHTDGSAGFDFYTREDTLIPKGKITLVPLNNNIRFPKGYMLILAARSSIVKRGLIIPNGIGIGDPDFSGNEDEYKIALYNTTTEDVTILRNERVAQGIIIKIEKVILKEVTDMKGNSRGGFGTTGK